MMLLVHATLRSERFVISSVSDVEDLALRKSIETFNEYTYWSSSNFGKSQVLDIGYATSVWNEYFGVALIRFNLTGLECGQLQSAKFRIYKPKCITQIKKEIPIYLHEISEANADWVEGNKESIEQKNASCWEYKTEGKMWAGEKGCSKAGVDFSRKPLGSSIACREKGEWLEFELPVELVQKWLENPKSNAGLILKTSEDVAFGEHVQFFSSEHYSGKAPELILDGNRKKARSPKISISTNKRYQLPSLVDPGYLKWLKEETFRYAEWSRDEQNLKLPKDKKIFPYLWDVVIDGEFILPYSYVTLSNNMFKLEKFIATRDTAACLRVMLENQNAWHIWEYTKEQNWYEAGNVVDEVLTPYQMAFLFANRIKKSNGNFSGIWSVYDRNGNWDKLSPDGLESNIKVQTDKFVSMSGITPEGLQKVNKKLREYIIIENQSKDSVKTALEELYKLLDTGKDSPALFDAMCRMGVYHDRMLFFQSIFGLPRLKLRYEAGGNPVAIAESWVKLKRGEYRMDRIQNRADISRKYWPESIKMDFPEMNFIDSNKN